jgi:hypothetical protein
MSQQPQLSAKAKENLRKNAELRQRDSKFVKIQAGEKRILEFNPEKIEPIEANFNGKKSQRYRYTVIDSNYPNEEKNLEVGKQTSEVIDTYVCVKAITYSKFKGLDQEWTRGITFHKPDNTKPFPFFW